MPRKATVSTARKPARYTVSIRPEEILQRGTPILVRASVRISPEAVRGVCVAGERVVVEGTDDGKSVRVDTSELAVGTHALRVDELVAARGDALIGSTFVPFAIVDTKAQIPTDLAVLHAVRLRVGELEVERLGMHEPVDAPFVDVFKAEDRTSGQPQQLAYDADGKPVDLDKELAALAKRRHERYGALHPTLHEAIQQADSGEPLIVAVWLHDPEAALAEKPAKGQARKRPAGEERARERWRATADRFVGVAARLAFESQRVDEAAPVVYGQMPARMVAELARLEDVAAVFLYEPKGLVDLSDSIAIANADEAHAAGVTGVGINVAVYEDGPDDTTLLSIAAQYETNPVMDDHSRHTHGIIKNIEANRPHGHAPDCNLHSANSMDLAAIQWAADRRCTVISQSFHRSKEQTSSGLSFDDVYKDHLVLHWPWPTICEAAGNGSTTEYVNHKGFNRLTVGNHNDSASGMASDSVYRNPSSTHADRELPDIAANGMAVTAVQLTKGGTSMAAPAVAGGAALIQQVNTTLRSWPEGCRAILLAAAWRNPAGGTWWSDVISGVDGVDGSGALDSGTAVQIARSRRFPNNSPSRRGWDVGTFTSTDVDRAGFATYVYRMSVPRSLFGAHAKVALAWDSYVTSLDIFGLSIPLSSQLTVDLDLQVRDSSGSIVGTSASWDNSHEILEFAPRRGETYEIRIRRWSGNDDVWYGLAWAVTGLEIFGTLAESSLVALGRR